MRYTCSGSPAEWAQSVDKCVSRDRLDLHATLCTAQWIRELNQPWEDRNTCSMIPRP
jgi:hypothetical protein